MKLHFVHSRALLAATLCFIHTNTALADAPKYLGTGSCSSSNCHGNVAPVTANRVLQNEYVTWQKHDKHSQAYKVLGNSDSATIVKHLGLRDAQREPLCLKCHSTYVPEVEQRGEKYQIEDGVTCEACHGAAGSWLTGHTTREATHARNLEQGLSDVASLQKRTKLCLSCHNGNDDKTVDHRLIGAGHPRLSFELDTFESIMPRHWKVDDDYKERKGDYQSANAWIEGQVSNSQESIEKLLSKKRNSNGFFPEFSMFNCYDCHHSLAGDQWKTADYGGHVGEPSINLASVTILREALKVTNPKAAGSIDSNLSTLHADFKNGKIEKTLRSLQSILKDKSLVSPISDGTRRKLFKQLANFAANTADLPYETAEQVAMGLSSLSAENAVDAKAIQPEMEKLYQALNNEEEFRAGEFTNAAKSVAAKAGRW